MVRTFCILGKIRCMLNSDGLCSRYDVFLSSETIICEIEYPEAGPTATLIKKGNIAQTAH